ncbi:uncharacterized protein CC84DRAFT_363635 [Paraphaeosphaeria sporulosa]|uniref:Uncharacterized protein n=1 Tax=Paraphaeosphaeria sporulosa TaxID=1460663 RepID=A0A177BZZ7_9PLEO|nr:uncharacterized protein CC84DRAFT_363635 [Paraphaeosphaeria sporulosa]OAG00219.1 hypothetical protein CC84DRAFT_363635 [Paraphaeosphaeria sporulosa]
MCRSNMSAAHVLDATAGVISVLGTRSLSRHRQKYDDSSEVHVNAGEGSGYAVLGCDMPRLPAHLHHHYSSSLIRLVTHPRYHPEPSLMQSYVACRPHTAILHAGANLRGGPGTAKLASEVGGARERRRHDWSACWRGARLGDQVFRARVSSAGVEGLAWAGPRVCRQDM